MRRVCFGLSVLVAVACGDNTRRETLFVHTTPELAPTVDELLRLIPISAEVVLADDPSTSLSPGGRAIAVSADLSCDGDCYRIDEVMGGYAVRAGNRVGAQYGLGQALEGLGIGFFHPNRTHVPEKLGRTIDATRLATLVEPQVARRGLHLHTLHPIEAYFAFWQPGVENLEDAKRIINWGILIGANYFQWTALDNILRDSDGPAWVEHNAAVLDYIHLRGAEAGIGVQLFGNSNLQNAFDLIDEPELATVPQIEQRLPTILGDFDWDHLSLSFGEFFGADADKFVADTNTAVAVLAEQSSQTTISATVHVGDDQRVDYMGANQIYYFLVRYADPAIIPWIHTVMYYNLFEDAGGAYHHDDFADHQEYLFERMAADEPVGYHPETAYWVAFDNSVPASCSSWIARLELPS